MTGQAPTFWLIAGPNGVGKTSYAVRSLKQLTGSINFINMDEIARGLSPLQPDAAERDAAELAISRARAMIAQKTTFAMETTMAGNVHYRLMQQAAANRMAVNLMYFSVTSTEICVERIARRVAEGGHHVPTPIVERRFERSHANLARYTAQCDLWRIYEASGPKPCLALEGRHTTLVHRDEVCLQQGNAMLQSFAGS